MARKHERYPALYERLSHDDELQDESNSISNQKRILEDYAEQHGFTNCIHFTDDGSVLDLGDCPHTVFVLLQLPAERSGGLVQVRIAVSKSSMVFREWAFR